MPLSRAFAVGVQKFRDGGARIMILTSYGETAIAEASGSTRVSMSRRIRLPLTISLTAALISTSFSILKSASAHLPIEPHLPSTVSPATTINMASNDNNTPTEPETYKQKLDRVATERRNAEQPQQVNPVVEKSTSPCATLTLQFQQCSRDVTNSLACVTQ